MSFVINGEVATPADESGNLKGITRTTLHKLCQVNKIPFHLRLIKVEDLKNATECFVSSATRGVMPVKKHC
ncbi:MAG: aminotransferase class IV [Deltaproteobacteria bacterium]|nr:aminotransferase class IV [Deltaproteobacteria bacterium]